MEDIKLGKIYAEAIYEFAKNDGKEIEVLKMLNYLVETLNEDEEVKKILVNPIISKEKKEELTNIILKEYTEYVDVINYLISKDRIFCISEIRNQFEQIHHNIHDEIIVTGVFPCELNESQKEKLVKKLEKLKNKKIILNIEIDENIISGGIIKINDEIIDGSLRKQIENLKETF